MSKEENYVNKKVSNIEKNEEVILVKGDNSKWYEQAIFIINPKKCQNKPLDFVKEAELIVSRYMNSNTVKVYENHNAMYNNTPKNHKLNTQNKSNIKNKSLNVKKSQTTGFVVSRELDVIINSIMLICCIILAGMVLNLMM